MPRQNMIHNPNSLRDLASRVREASKLLDEAAADLHRAAPNKSVSLPYQETIESGIIAIELMAQDVTKKIKQEKFLDVVPPREGKPSGEVKKVAVKKAK